MSLYGSLLPLEPIKYWFKTLFLINLLNLNCFKNLEEQMFNVLLIIKHVLIL